MRGSAGLELFRKTLPSSGGSNGAKEDRGCTVQASYHEKQKCKGSPAVVKEQAQQNLQLKAIRVCPGGSAGTDIGFVQISAHPQGPAAPPPPPETFGPYSKKTEESA